MKITMEVIQVSFGNDMEKIKAKTKVDATRREYFDILTAIQLVLTTIQTN